MTDVATINIKNLTLREKVGQLFMPAAFINDTEEEIQALEKLITEGKVGGICFFHSRASAATNFEGKKKIVKNEQSFNSLKNLIQRYQKVSMTPLLIAIDAEWGLAMRIENTPQYPYAITLGAIQDDELIFQVGKNIAKDCKAAGIHWNLSPVVDINNNPNNPVIGYRSFGEDRNLVTQKALAYAKGAQSEGVPVSIKHFPGHGDTATDSHLGLPHIDKSKAALIQNELYPFQKLIDEGAEAVMVGHLSVPALAGNKNIPSSISKEIIKGVLRNEMGFEGVVISDALNMHAVSKNYPEKGKLEWLAFDAGNDILCFAENTMEGIEKILKNASEEQIEESFHRVYILKEKAFGHVDNEVSLTDASPLNTAIAKKSITLYKGNVSDMEQFRKEGFQIVCNRPEKATSFLNGLSFENCNNILDFQAFKDENLLLALFPPQIKPNNNFGFSVEELEKINLLLASGNTVLYLFGNPYVLNHLQVEKAKAVVIAYQDFKEFQEVAQQHFLGEHQAVGKLPVTIEK
ncbi:glycoside hydrolase family 3 protein [Euzebyella saccharophila]|uniref:beta-N-acetylhexosaminidase n=1 Tax=Euzebyella saccharophila TaxID=679664 RepID=A0ABV8JUQ9_9FLAO|nr:glycoside hydrolase family 3 protein [Euzebyella saccharophila]